MTVFAQHFFTFLSNAGTSAGSRVYPKSLPQRPTFRAITYLQVSDAPEYTHSGRSKLRHPRYQLDCYDEDTETNDGYLGAVTLANEVINLIDGYKGPMGSIQCEAGFHENAQDNFDPETNRHWVTLDFEIWHKEA